MTDSVYIFVLRPHQAESIRAALDGEWYFYGAVLGFPSAMPLDLPPITIDNLMTAAAS